MDLAFVGRTSRSAADLLVSLAAQQPKLRSSPLLFAALQTRFFKGVPMGLRPINDNENRLRDGSVSDLAWSFFSSASASGRRFFNGAPMGLRIVGRISRSAADLLVSLHAPSRPTNEDEKPVPSP
jgi:hypothetical protein